MKRSASGETDVSESTDTRSSTSTKSVIATVKAELARTESLREFLDYVENKSEKTREISHLNDEIEKRIAELDVLKNQALDTRNSIQDQLAKTKKEADDILEAAQWRAKEIVTKAEGVFDERREELAKAKARADDMIAAAKKEAHGIASGVKGQLSELREALADEQSKYDGLKHKVRKLQKMYESISSSIEALKKRFG